MRSLVVSNEMSESDPERFEHLVSSVRDELIHLSAFYPSFAEWYDRKVVPGLVDGDRTLLLRFVNGRLGGIGITKDDGLEKKLCCLRVLPHMAGSGLGLRLFDDAFDLLQTDKPLLSVSGEQLLNFKKIFTHFGFVHGRRYDDLYRAGSVEHSYNGQLVSGARKPLRVGGREQFGWGIHSLESL